MKTSFYMYLLQCLVAGVMGFLLKCMAGITVMHDLGAFFVMMLLFITPGLCIRSLGCSKESLVLQGIFLFIMWVLLDSWGTDVIACASLLGCTVLHAWLVLEEEKAKAKAKAG